MCNCWYCGSQMYWQSDFNFEDYGLEGEGIVTELMCSGCNATATFYQSIEEMEVKKPLVQEVIEHLNITVGTRFKASTNKTKKCINARAKEGYTLDDFKKVIDKKAKEWLDTEMEKYLRPDTLFGNNFEIYLNQKGCEKNGANTIRSIKPDIVADKEKFGSINFKGKL